MITPVTGSDLQRPGRLTTDQSGELVDGQMVAGLRRLNLLAVLLQVRVRPVLMH